MSGTVFRMVFYVKTMLEAMNDRTFKHSDKYLSEATWLVNTQGSANQDGPAQSSLLCAMMSTVYRLVCPGPVTSRARGPTDSCPREKGIKGKGGKGTETGLKMKQ